VFLIEATKTYRKYVTARNKPLSLASDKDPVVKGRSAVSKGTVKTNRKSG
jgi:hypothetical protein